MATPHSLLSYGSVLGRSQAPEVLPGHGQLTSWYGPFDVAMHGLLAGTPVHSSGAMADRFSAPTAAFNHESDLIRRRCVWLSFQRGFCYYGVSRASIPMTPVGCEKKLANKRRWPQSGMGKVRRGELLVIFPRTLR